MRGIRWCILGFCATAIAVGAQAQRGATVVIVVRHAEKDVTPRIDPPLTAAGVARANALAAALADANVQAIITTQLRRTRETASPLAKRLRLDVQSLERGPDIGAHARAVAAAVRRHAGGTVLVVGHGETVGPIIAALGGPRIRDLCLSEYSHLFVLVIDTGATRFIRSEYGAPSPPPTDGCVPQSP
jgi:broad specificity phosphatase PhoE